MALVRGRESEEDLRRLMPPPPTRPPAEEYLAAQARPPEKIVVDEEQYTCTVEAIIERDYFPDIPKMQNQLEWVQAVNSGDPGLIRQAQINIARRRAGLKTPSTGLHEQARGWTATPGTGLLRTPAMTPLTVATPAELGSATPGPDAGGATPGPAAAGAVAAAPRGVPRAPAMSLDKFLATHTSEDNASFLKLQEKTLAHKRRRVAHHLVDHNGPLQLEGPAGNPTEEYGSSGQEPYTLALWNHNPLNSLYYVPGAKPLTIKERTNDSRLPGRSINVRGTRVKPEDLPDEHGEGGAAAAAIASAAAAGLREAGAGGLGDYNRLTTPALTPGGLGASPFMTWGDIESTPLRLDGPEGEEGVVAFDPHALEGPTFKIPEMPRREQVGHDLAAAKTIKELRNRQRKAGEGAAAAAAVAAAGGVRPGSQQRGSSLLRAGTPSGGAGAVAMSPAAKKLASMMRARQAGATPSADRDAMLRASYSGRAGTGPHVPGSAHSTPSRASMTPGATAAAAAARLRSQSSTPLLGKHSAGSGAGPVGTAVGAGQQSITDDLLNL